MPDWLQPIADHQPITPVIEAIRDLLMDAPLNGNGWWAAGWCVLLLMLTLALSAFAFRRKAGRR